MSSATAHKKIPIVYSNYPEAPGAVGGSDAVRNIIPRWL